MHYTPKTKPFRHQARATIQAARARNYALFMEPRTGKTKAVIDYVGMLHAKGEVQRVLVLCPLISIDVWIHQLRLHAPYNYSWETADETWEGKTIRPGAGVVQYYFLNYEKAARRTRKRSGSYKYPYLDEVQQFRPDLVVCDESHRLKRAGGVTARAVWRMVRRLRGDQNSRPVRPYVLLLSGTPNPKGWIDLFAQFRILDETILGTSKADFEEEYVVYGKGRQRFTTIKYRNKQRLLKKVRAHSISVTSEEAGLAGKQFTQTLWYDLPPRARRYYNEMAEEFITEVEDGRVVTAANSGVKRLRLLQIAGGYLTDGSEIHGSGINTVRGYLRDLCEQGEHVVLYARFVPELHELHRAAEQAGYRANVLAGFVHRRDRPLILKQFQRAQGGHVQALVCQVQVGSVSIELTRAAEAIFYSLPDGWEQYRQCRDRLGGPNQSRPVRYTHVMAHGTVHSSVLHGLRRKQDWHRELLTDPRAYLYGDYPGMI